MNLTTPQLSEENEGSPETPAYEDDLSLRIELAASKALENLREHRRRQWLIMIGISSTLVLVVSSILGFLVNELLNIRVRTHVEATIDQALQDTRFKVELAHLTLSSTNLTARLAGKGVAAEELTRIQAELDVILQTYIRELELESRTRLEREQDIVPIIAEMIDISATIGADQYVDAFYGLAPEILESSNSVTQTMVQHTGRALIGDAGAPSTWFGSDRQPSDEYKLYKTLADRAKSSGYPELFLAFEMVVRDMEGVSEIEMRELIDDAMTLNEVDRRQFEHLMTAHAGGMYSAEPDASVFRVAARFSAFLEKYEELNAWIKSEESTDR